MLSLKFDQSHFIKVLVVFWTVIKLKLGHGFFQFTYRLKIGIFDVGLTFSFQIFPNWTFYYFRRVNSEISKDFKIMGVINWFMLLAVPENLSENFSNDEGDSVWSLTQDDDNKNISGQGTYTVIWIYVGHIFIGDLGKLSVTYYSPYILWVTVETTVSDETAFHANWLVTKVPFHIFWGCGIIFSEMVCV